MTTEDGRLKAAYLEAAEGMTLGPEDHDAVVSLELVVSEVTGHLSAFAVRHRGPAGESYSLANRYTASWSEADGAIPDWAMEWARRLGIR